MRRGRVRRGLVRRGLAKLGRSGATAVEMALLLPALMIMLFGTFQYGFLLFTYNSMLDAARSSSRSLAVGKSTEAQARSFALQTLPGWIQASAFTVTPRDTPTTGSTQVDTTITVQTASASILSFLPMPAQLTAKVVMRKES